MPATVKVTRKLFTRHRQGRRFADVLNDPGKPFDEALSFFSHESRQRRMEESEIHHDRPPLAGVVREREEVRNNAAATQVRKQAVEANRVIWRQKQQKQSRSS